MRESPARGQSMIEVVVAILIAGIVLGAMAIAVVTGLKSSNYAKNQAQATKYVQQAIDDIRTIRDNVGGVESFKCSGGSCPSSTTDCQVATSPCTFQDLFYYKFPPSSGSTDYGSLSCDASACYFEFDTSGSSLALKGISSTSNPPVTSVPIADDNFFSQKIALSTSNSGCNQKINITVTVAWTDQSGPHQAEAQTVLSDYQQQVSCG